MIRLMHEARAKWLMLALLSACSGEPGGPDPSAVPSVPSAPDPGTQVAVSPPDAVGELSEQLAQARQVTPDELRANHAVEFASELGYDPLTAPGLDAMLTALGVQAAAETKARLAQTGFAIGGAARRHLRLATLRSTRPICPCSSAPIWCWKPCIARTTRSSSRSSSRRSSLACKNC